ncbi:hypothetical protein PROFUN_03583 [Planoprotostelium fungivorum]|nr:hypothetical protein PROFUN_03583 [Planoprotostelium fungivorum]
MEDRMTGRDRPVEPQPSGFYRFNEEAEEVPADNPMLNFFVPLMLSMTLNNPKSYWNMTYTQQMDTFQQLLKDRDPAGEEPILDSLFVWYGNECVAVSLMLIKQLIGISNQSSILDLGTGNGHFCEALSTIGFEKITGSDFSESAIELAKSIQQSHAESMHHISYIEDDILQSSFSDDRFEVIYDKGTLDSIAMVSSNLVPDEIPEEKGEPPAVETYREEVIRILKPGGYLIVVSCNHTKDELLDLFVKQTGGAMMMQHEVDVFTDLRILCFQKQIRDNNLMID